MTRRTAILQTTARVSTAAEALDVALALASMDQPVQLILVGKALNVLAGTPSKRYAMLELLDAEPILVVTDKLPDDFTELDIETIGSSKLRPLLDSFDEVLQFS